MISAKHITACLTGFLACTFSTQGQVFRPGTEGGVFAGVSYYLGEINPRRQFYAPGAALGGLVKHNFTEHHSLRVSAFYGQLKGNDYDFKNEYQQARAHSFSTALLDFHAGWEFNFMPYIINRKTKTHTSYVFAALGYSLVLSSTAGTARSHAAIPFGAGYKYRFNDAVAIGCEWGMRKTFTDSLDGLLNPGPDGSHSKTHNNDWYSFAGIFAVFRIFEKNFACPAIKEQTTYR
jgi:hypothetical protein